MIYIVKNDKDIVEKHTNSRGYGDGRVELMEFIKKLHPDVEINYRNSMVYLNGMLIYYNKFVWCDNIHSIVGADNYSIYYDSDIHIVRSIIK